MGYVSLFCLLITHLRKYLRPVISQTFLTIYLVKQILEMKVFLRPGTTDIVNVCKIDAKGRLKKAPTQKHYLLTLLPPPPSFGPNA
jgi:hypothetical protein